MESGSRIETSTEPPPSRLANFAGVVIALITLVLPVVAIAYYSAMPPLIPAQNYVPPPSRGL
ncbi:hypothetical protein [Vacuolonema iberomarrocanum]|uniref:hypothetical protein n=1 Tax=Vacuolonema iberomarrocanum TaxID=3454632 RepID=UPI001A00715E|nr:hypothetical protein [filamentous cyanobacterium LEGE 07170]